MSETDIAVIILAAGKGTRMQSSLPKVLHKVGGKRMIDHVLDTSIALRAEKIITVLRKEMEDVRDAVAQVSEVAIQEQQLGTGDAVKAAMANLRDFKGHVIILYADTPLIHRHTIHQMLEELSSNTSIVVLGFRPDDPGQYGRIVTNQQGEVNRIVEFKDASEAEKEINLCNSGVIAIKASLLSTLIDEIENNNSKGEYYLTDIVKIAKEKSHNCNFIEADKSEVLGVNNRQELSQAERIFQERMRASMMLKGVTLLDPDSTYLSYDIKVGRDIIIHPNVVFGPNVIIEDNVEIHPFTHIEGAHISANASIGPFARIRPGTDIGAHAKVGNFVEIKQAEIGDHSKISHLSYIGDAHVGMHTNIGAGTITCNYNGYQKSKTNIGNNVFIGSNTALIAPIKIGSGAIVGAGSTLNKDVAPDCLIFSERNVISREEGAESFRKAKEKKDS